MRFKKVIIAVKFEENVFHSLQEFKKLGINELTEVQFVHVVPVTVYGGLQVNVSSYPFPEDHAKIEDSVKHQLRQISLTICPGHEKTLLRCLFGTNVKESFNDYVRLEHADLVVIPLRERVGLAPIHESSFAQFMMRHATANILLLKNRNPV